MAGRGRGRGATLPAWMTEGGGVGINNNSETFSISREVNIDNNAIYDDVHDRGDRKKRSRSRSRDDRNRYSRDRDGRDSRDRNRDQDRGRNRYGDPRDRSVSNDRGGGGGGGGGGGWRPGRKRVSNFDVAPLPGEEDQLPNILGFAQASGGSQGFSSGASDSFTKHARKIYIGNLPANTTEDHIRDFFHDVISNCIPRGEIDPFQNHVIQVLNHMDKGFAFVEFSSIELTSAILLIDGAKYNFRNGSTIIRIRRPNDYKENLVPASTRPPIELCNLEYLGISPNVEGNKLFIANIPYQLTDEEVRTLLIVPGELKAFHLVREPGQLNHKGYGFAEYIDKSTAERAKLILTTIDFQGKKLTVTDASSKVSGSQNPMKVNYGTQSQQQAHPMNAANLPQPGGHYGSNQGGIYGNNANPNYGNSNNYGDNYNDTGNYNNSSSNYGYNDPYQNYPSVSPVYKPSFDQLPPTTVIKLVNMVTKEELEDDQEFFDIIEDVRAECSEYGQVISVLIPRTKDRFPEYTQGSIYVHFRDKNHSKNAAIALSGRKFAERTVVVEYFDEVQFLNRQF